MVSSTASKIFSTNPKIIPQTQKMRKSQTKTFRSNQETKIQPKTQKTIKPNLMEAWGI